MIDDIDNLVIDINKNIESKNYDKLELYNDRGNELYTTYSMWLLKPEI